MENNATTTPLIGQSWLKPLEAAFNSPGFAQLRDFLITERARHTVYPKGREIFRAFDLTPFKAVSVVILGQDPYHGPGQAHGLSFSVPKGVALPPSLQNIFQELNRDLGIPRPAYGDLSSWAEQGVLLLNATLTVRAHEAGSHQGRGWEGFSDLVIKRLSEERTGLVFLLWGRFAQQKEALIDPIKHTVLKAPHPSPLSAHRGFIGCGHFGKVNALRKDMGQPPIDWSLP